MFKLVLDSADKIPEGMSSAYKEKDGKFHLKLDDDVVPKGQLKEFRDNNIALMKSKEELEKSLKKFDGIDLDVYKETLKKKRDLDDKKLMDAGKVDELVDKRVERMKADFDGQTKSLNAKIDELSTNNVDLNSHLSSVLIDSKIQQAINEVGKPKGGAMQDILSRGRDLFRLVDGKPVPIGPDKNPIFGKDGKAPMTFVEWASGLRESAGFLFESAQGGGGPGGRGSGDGPGKTIASGDPVAFGRNLEGIAKGKVAVK